MFPICSRPLFTFSCGLSSPQLKHAAWLKTLNSNPLYNSFNFFLLFHHPLGWILESYWDRSAFETDTDLPAGWMRVRDTSGTYYWHIPTGTTQWEPPSPMEEGAVPERPSSTSPAITPSEETQVQAAIHLNVFLLYIVPLILYTWTAV